MNGIPQGMSDLTAQVRSSECPTDIADLFERCIANTWQTTIKQLEDGSYFVITGDIPAMWLRDSSMQVLPYLRLTKDPQIAHMLHGLIRKQAFYITIDPYANAFNEKPDGSCWDKNDRTDQSPWDWERKYELDSLCFPLWMARRYAEICGDWEVFDAKCKEAYERILDVFETEQHHMERSAYSFERDSDLITETLPRGGKGSPVGETGMIWSGFRPSDDACTYGYLVPSNMLACTALEGLREINRHVWNDAEIDRRADAIEQAVREGIRRFAVASVGGRDLYAYETDGLGAHLWMDDANYPSLLSAPFFGFCAKDDPLYLNTRDFVLSEQNPFYYSGDKAAGVGSPHTPQGGIWPLALAMQGLTSRSLEEKRALCALLTRTDGGCGYMHESFNKDDDRDFTRPWFSWANSMFCELVLHTYLDA